MLGFGGSKAAICAIAVVVFMLAVGLMPPAWAAEEPKAGTYFEYKYKQKIDDGAGEYSGWTESTKGEGRYEVKAWLANEALLNARYTWEYTNDDYEDDSARVDLDFSFNLTSRRYTSTEIDLDDEPLAGMPPASLAVWFWVPPTVREGQQVQILDMNGTVTDTDAVIWSRWVPRRAIEVVVKGAGTADEEYGDLLYTYVDRLYFDRRTGMFFAERYIEHDTGTFEGLYAEFDSHIKIDVVESSYDVEVAWGTLASVYARNLIIIALVLLGIGYVVHRVRWAAKTIPVFMQPAGTQGPAMGGERDYKLRRVWRARDLPRLRNAATEQFGPFLEHWVEKSLRGRDRVAVAIDQSTRELAGIAFYNREGRIGTVLCRDMQVNELLRRFIRAKDFFSETRHMYGSNAVYNVFETQNVYRLDGIPDVTYDASVVRPMTEADMGAVVDLAKQVYKAKARKWVRACHGTGDLGYVAVVDGRIVGFGFACVCGTHGRLHSLAVDPAYRGRGLAKQLHRARLHAMRLMGVVDVVDEIADWNLASIRISTLSGFQPVGKMYVETVRKKRIKKNIVRR